MIEIAIGTALAWLVIGGFMWWIHLRQDGPITMRRFLTWLRPLLGRRRIIRDREGTEPYLGRSYIVGLPKMADGSWPFDETGNPRKDAIWSKVPLGVYLHQFFRSDNSEELHSHPWKWAVSFVLAGGYWEYRLVNGEIVKRLVKPWRLNFIRASTLHRVELIEKDAWSLIIVGPKSSAWGFYNVATKIFMGWREYHKLKRAA